MIEVTQADRDIASAIGVCPIIYTPHEVRSGMRDHTPFVQAFATHRIEAAKAERDRILAFLRDHDSYGAWRRAAETIESNTPESQP